MTYKIGDRVRTTIDSSDGWEGSTTIPAGALGTITAHHPSHHGVRECYGVLLDDDPSQMSGDYYPHEIEPA